MAINFPNSPVIDQTYSQGATTWKWNGFAWEIIPASSLSLTSLTATTISATDINVSGTTIFSGGVSGVNLSSLGDVTLGTPLNGQVLTYNSGLDKWAPSSVSGGSAFNGGTVTNPLFVNNTANTTGSTTGALRVAGGAFVGDDLFVAGTIIVEDEQIELRASSEIRFYNTNNSNYVGFSAPDTISAPRIYVLPQSDGTSGQFLRTNGSGILSWASAVGEGGGTPPGGLNTQIQFNDNNSFGGDSNLTYDSLTQLFSAPKITASGQVTITDASESTDSTTGAMKVAGGLAVEKQINVAGSTNKFTGNTSSTSTTTGTIVVTGGMGISGAVNIGSTVSANTAPSAAEHLTNKRYVDANVLAFSVAFGA